LAQPGGEGNLDIKSDQIAQPSTVSMANVKEINPPEKKPIKFTGNLGFGGSISTGNTQTRTMSFIGEFEARSDRQRLTLRGGYNYADHEGQLEAQNGRVGLKYDFFITKRFYWFASAFFEHDGMQDLSLRTALSTGPGFQIIDKGDFTADWLKEMQLYAEAGIAYFDEDFKRAKDNTYVAARWAIKFDWPFVPKKITFFHHHEGYPSLEDAEDIYITTETGLRFAIWNNFVATAQINWRWDNTPSPGFERSDTIYLLTLGYNFEF
jgi:putative salt-induced outer membrane protein YdiY